MIKYHKTGHTGSYFEVRKVGVKFAQSNTDEDVDVWTKYSVSSETK